METVLFLKGFLIILVGVVEADVRTTNIALTHKCLALNSGVAITTIFFCISHYLCYVCVSIVLYYLLESTNSALICTVPPPLSTPLLSGKSHVIFIFRCF